MILLTIGGALLVSGQFTAFAQNRGFLQLVIAIPLACLLASVGVAFLGVFRPAQMLWALAPVVVLILVGAGFLDVGVAALPWVMALSGFVVVPWMVGTAVGMLLRDWE